MHRTHAGPAGAGNGHFRSLTALTLPKKLGEILVRDDLTIALLPQRIRLAYLKYKKLFNKPGSYVSLLLIKHQHLSTRFNLLQFCPVLYLWWNKLPWLTPLAQSQSVSFIISLHPKSIVVPYALPLPSEVAILHWKGKIDQPSQFSFIWILHTQGLKASPCWNLTWVALAATARSE